jgi:hypothetical protein
MQGYAIADRQIEVGLCSLAVPLLSRSGQVVAALNVGVPASAMSAAALREKALAPLRRAAMALSLSYRASSFSAPAPDCARSRRPAATAAPGGRQHQAVSADKCGFRRRNQRMRRNRGQRLRQRDRLADG